MLLAADADLIARDRSLPGLQILLDPELIRQLLEQQGPSFHVNSIQATYLRYKPRMNCLVAYRVLANDLWVDVYAKAYRSGEQAKLWKSKKKEIANAPFASGVFIFPDSGISICIFPNDRKLKSIVKLNSDEQRRSSFQKIFKTRPEFWDAQFEKLNYKPERRYVAKLLVEGKPKAVLKCYLESDFFNVRGNTRIFRSSEKVRVPHKIAHSKRNFWIAYEWLEGNPLIVQKSNPDDFWRVGIALAELHKNKPEEINHFSREKMIKEMIDQVDDLSFLYPDSEREIRQVAGEIAALLHKEPLDWGPIHGDFNASQVILDDASVRFLDLDEVVYTDVCKDIGNFLANLQRDAWSGNISFERAEEMGKALLDGYRSIRALSQHSEPYTALGLFKLISEPFRFRNTNWHSEGKKHLKRIQSLLSDSLSFKSSTIPLVKPEQPDQVPVIDPFHVLVDPEMPFLAEALSPLEMQFQFGKCLPFSKVHLRSIRVTRYKPGKRCLVDYDLQTNEGPVTIIGKVRAKGLDRSAYQTLLALQQGDFALNSPDNISVPAPIGLIPDFHMYLQRRVNGISASELFKKTTIAESSIRIADAIHKLHQAKVPVQRRHGIQEELGILEDRFNQVILQFPNLKSRMEKLMERCKSLAGIVRDDPVTGIHRDFYADQVLFSGDRIFLLDFDSFCEGSPALDAGNFLAHLTEQGLREFGNAESLCLYERAFRSRFLQLAGYQLAISVEVYELLSLARHIFLSTQFRDRSHLTEPILHLCETRMASINMDAGRTL